MCTPTLDTKACAAAQVSTVTRLGCVSFLNAKPLIYDIEKVRVTGKQGSPTPPKVVFDVPARLLPLLESNQVDLALCPVIDYHRAGLPLTVVPVGGICSDGPTFTVRLFSQIPIERITTLHADTDSHTSVVLVQVLLREMFDLRPRMVPCHAGQSPVSGTEADSSTPVDKASEASIQAMLLIGDKVVTQSPTAIEYPYQLDLGEAWKKLTGLPFVFATWLARADADLGDLPHQLDQLRGQNAQRIDEIVETYAQRLGWPAPLAHRYLGRILRYGIGPRELEAIERFGELAVRHGLIERNRPLTVRKPVV